jgi:hypothetical protein
MTLSRHQRSHFKVASVAGFYSGFKRPHADRSVCELSQTRAVTCGIDKPSLFDC